jgi:hypothetical protein
MRFCTHSKYETVTPPALARMSGITKMPFSSRIASAAAVVGPLAPSQIDLGRMLRRVLGRDHVLERRRHQHIDVEREQLSLSITSPLQSPRACDASPRGRWPRPRRCRFALCSATKSVGNGDHLAPFARHQLRRHRADVAEALHGHRGALHRHPRCFQRLARDEHAAASRRLAPAVRTAHLDGLPVTTAFSV